MIPELILPVTLAVIAFLWLLAWAAVDTFWPDAPLRWYRARQQGPQFNPQALSELQRLVDDLRREVDQNGWPHWTALLITVALRLGEIGRLLSSQAQRQVERFTGRALRQMAEDAHTMPARPETLTYMLWHLEALVRAVETRRVSALLEAIAALFHVIHLRDEAFTLPEPIATPALYPHFERELTQYLSHPVDTVAFFGFLQRWRNLALSADTHLFLLVRVLDAFRRPLFQIQYAGTANEPRMTRLRHWAMAYLDGLKRRDRLAQYRALCFLITELQLVTEMASEEDYLVRLETQRRHVPTEQIPELSPSPGLLRDLRPVEPSSAPVPSFI